MIEGKVELLKMKGLKIAPGIWLLDEPTPVEGTNKLRCLAQVGSALCVVELKIYFGRTT